VKKLRLTVLRVGFHLFNSGICHLIRGLDEMYNFINLELKLLIENLQLIGIIKLLHVTKNLLLVK